MRKSRPRPSGRAEETESIYPIAMNLVWLFDGPGPSSGMLSAGASSRQETPWFRPAGPRTRNPHSFRPSGRRHPINDHERAPFGAQPNTRRALEEIDRWAVTLSSKDEPNPY